MRKRIVIILFSIIASLSSFKKTGSKGLSFGFIDKTQKCSYKSLITESDIENFDWSKQELTLKNDALVKVKTIKISADTFLIKVNDTIVYKGLFEKSIRSDIGLKSPSILIDLDSTVTIMPNNKVKIWYHGNKTDERENDYLRNYLLSKNLLVE